MIALSAYDRIVDALRDRGGHVIEQHGRARAQCPAHNDGRPSLSITRIDGSLLLHCHTGCQSDDVLAALKMTRRDLYDEPNGATYEYPDGRRVYRTPDKKFRQSGNRSGSSLFHADRIGDATTVYIVEGEKDVLAVESAGAVSVCPAMGAGKADKFDWSPLRDKHAIVIADKDEPGVKHATQVAALLTGIAASVRVVEAAEGKDFADHFAAGKTFDELVIADVAVPELPKMWKAVDLRPAQQPEWLGRRWIPRAAPTILVGDEGIGKSLFWVLVVAAITTGQPLPECGIPARDPALVVLVITEDDWTTVVLPRLIVANADLNHVRVICTDDDGSGAPVFPRDLHLLYAMSTPPAAIVVDAWLDTVPAGLTVRDPQGARQALHPWRELSTRTSAAVLLLTHTNRVATGNARDRYGATSELRKKARMAIYAQQDDDGRLVIGPEKANSVATADAAVFAIDAIQHFAPTDDDDGTVGRLRFLETSDRTARQHLTDSWEAEHGEDRQDRVAAVEWLRDYLEAEGPQVNSAEVKRQAKSAGISERTLQRARKDIGIIWGRSGFGKASVTTWSLPTEGGTANENDSADSHTDALTNNTPLLHGTSGTTGITEGQTVMPSHAKLVNGTTVAQLTEQDLSAVVPPVPRTQGVVAPLPTGYDGTDPPAKADAVPRRPGCVCENQPTACFYCTVDAAKHGSAS